MEAKRQPPRRRIARFGQFKAQAVRLYKALADAGVGLWRPGKVGHSIDPRMIIPPFQRIGDGKSSRT